VTSVAAEEFLLLLEIAYQATTIETTEKISDASATTNAKTAIWWSERFSSAPNGLVLFLAGVASTLLGLGVAVAAPLLVRLSVAGKRLLVKALLKMPDGKLLSQFLLDMVNS
jgi:uncharacterized protein involved in exopolysaccharide biosynthesis